LSALTDALNGVACVVASTVVVALAYPLIIPLSVILQWLMDGISPSKWGALGWIGTVLVIVGVFCLEGFDSDGDDGSIMQEEGVVTVPEQFDERGEKERVGSNTQFVNMDMMMNMTTATTRLELV
jgi:hypothetical protein